MTDECSMPPETPISDAASATLTRLQHVRAQWLTAFATVHGHTMTGSLVEMFDSLNTAHENTVRQLRAAEIEGAMATEEKDRESAQWSAMLTGAEVVTDLAKERAGDYETLWNLATERIARENRTSANIVRASHAEQAASNGDLAPGAQERLQQVIDARNDE